MLQLPEISPDKLLLDDLRSLQKRVNGKKNYAAQVDCAKRFWRVYRISTLRDVKVLLVEMCSGGRRCCYCEDSLGTDIEHIWPKSLYPDRTFDWMNYILVCSLCNKHKGAHWAVFHSANSSYQIVSRPPSAKPTFPPLSGTAVFIDPRQEDGMQFLILDLQNSFRFVVQPSLRGRERERAEYTLQRLPFNDDAICQERANEYQNYVARLRDYLCDKQQSADPARLERHRTSLLRLRHPTVFREMQRQHSRIPELTALFAKVPEALSW